MAEPTSQALVALRNVHAPLGRAEERARQAEQKLAQAREAFRVHDEEASQRAPADVAAGRASVQDLEAAIARARVSAAGIAAAEKVLAEAQAGVEREIAAAVRAMATSIRDRRERLRRELPNAKVKELPRFNAADWALIGEADALRDVHGNRLLAGQDVGELLGWERSAEDEIVQAGRMEQSAAAAVQRAGGAKAVYWPNKP